MEDSFYKDFFLSLFFHIGLIIIFSVKYVFYPDQNTLLERAIRVDIVDLPEKARPLLEQKPTETTPQKPEEATVRPKPPPASVEPTVTLQKKSNTQTKQKDAFEKLKQMEAFEEIEKQLKKEKTKASGTSTVSGEMINKGEDLKGVALLQHANYVDQVGKRIRKNWVLPSWLVRKTLTAQARIKVDENGNIILKEIVKSSGNPEYDNKILDAIQNSTPLPQPPTPLSNLLKYEGVLLGFPE